MNTTIHSNDIPNSHNVDQANEKLDSTTVCRIPSCQDAENPVKRIIACRARGVCDTHTPQSAYFEIPQDCEHGTSFVCSHDLCRESGRLFRYCKVCDQITAKRNFSKRHAHLIAPRSPTCPVEMVVINDDAVSSTNSKKRRKLLCVSPDGDSHAGSSRLADLMCSFKKASTCEDDLPMSTTSILVPRFHQSAVCSVGEAVRNPSMLRMGISPTEARLIERIRSNQDNELETISWVYRILAERDRKRTRMEQDYLPDTQGVRQVQPQSRLPSLDGFEIFDDIFNSIDFSTPNDRNLTLSSFFTEH